MVRRRALAIAFGVALVVPAAWIEVASPSDAWWIDGLALVLGATGIAFIWAAASGIQPDWIDDGES